MNVELKQQWIDALKSGGYTQGKGFLRKRGKFCCLGVLCDIVDSSRWVSLPRFHSWKYGNNSQDITISELSGALLNEFGLSFEEQNDLITLNDSGHSFDKIAQYIE